MADRGLGSTIQALKKRPLVEVAKELLELRRFQQENIVLRRLLANLYLPWTNAGGPNECEHGYAAGIACRKCDMQAVGL